MMPGGLVSSTESLPETLTADLWSSDSSKSHKSKNASIEELTLDLKRNNKHKPTASSTEKKCCKCKKSRCLMLYCECFRAGQIC